MDKKPLIGVSVLAVVLLVLPTIPAIELKIVQGTIGNTIQSQKENILSKQVKSHIKKGEVLKHRFLLYFVSLIAWFRLARWNLLYSISVYEARPDQYVVRFPLLFLRSEMLYITTMLRIGFWYYIAYILGWNWEYQDFLIQENNK
jgi:hypothetical protein